MAGLLAAFVHVNLYLGGSAAVNAIGHHFGRRPYPNGAGNLQWLAFITAGEGLHNNHHAAPTSAKLSHRWFEIDPGWWVIKTCRLGLAKVRLSELRLRTRRAGAEAVQADTAKLAATAPSDGPRAARRGHRPIRQRRVDAATNPVNPDHGVPDLAGMHIVSALFVENFEMRQAPGPSTRIDLTGAMFSMAAPSSRRRSRSRRISSR